MTELISVAGALVSVYVVFALLTSRISEAISTMLNKRGETLYDGIVALLGATQRTARGAAADAKAISLAGHLYAHPLVSNLGEIGPRKPSYMEARTFTLSLVSVLRDTVLLEDAEGRPRVVGIASAPDVLLADLQDRIKALGPGDATARSLTLVLQDAERTYDGALHAIDGWFEGQMDRISGVYRRWIGTWQAGIALVLVVVANADTIAILQQLFKDSSAVSALGALGHALAKDPNALTVDQMTKAVFSSAGRKHQNGRCPRKSAASHSLGAPSCSAHRSGSTFSSRSSPYA